MDCLGKMEMIVTVVFWGIVNAWLFAARFGRVKGKWWKGKGGSCRYGGISGGRNGRWASKRTLDVV